MCWVLGFLPLGGCFLSSYRTKQPFLLREAKFWTLDSFLAAATSSPQHEPWLVSPRKQKHWDQENANAFAFFEKARLTKARSACRRFGAAKPQRFSLNLCTFQISPPVWIIVAEWKQSAKIKVKWKSSAYHMRIITTAVSVSVWYLHYSSSPMKEYLFPAPPFFSPWIPPLSLM